MIFTNGASFFQYPLVCIGQVSILVGELATVNTVANDRNRRRACIIAIMAAYFFMIFLYNIFTSIPDLKYYKDTWAENDVFPWIRLVEEVPEHDKNSFVAYGPNEFKDVYLVTGTRCPYKYFVIQEWHALFSEKVSNEISYIYENGDAKWILLSGGSSHIDKALNERYFVYDSLEGYTLYRLK